MNNFSPLFTSAVKNTSVITDQDLVRANIAIAQKMFFQGEILPCNENDMLQAKKACDLLVTSNARLVFKRIGDSKDKPIYNDLLQNGLLGLYTAISYFDLSQKETKFSSFAMIYINSALNSCKLSNYRVIALGTNGNNRKIYYQLDRVKQRLLSLEGSASTEKIAEVLGIKEKHIILMQQHMQQSASFDAPVSNSEDSESRSLGETLNSNDITQEEKLDLERQKMLLHSCIETLKPTFSILQQEILNNRVLATKERTLQDIGNEFNISPERVRQVENDIRDQIKRLFLRNMTVRDQQYLVVKEKK